MDADKVTYSLRIHGFFIAFDSHKITWLISRKECGVFIIFQLKTCSGGRVLVVTNINDNTHIPQQLPLSLIQLYLNIEEILI
jgi:hypothetical protein